MDASRNFVWFDLMTTDLPSSLDFYRGLLPEWDVRQVDIPGGGGKYNMVHVDDVPVCGFVPLDAEHGIPSHWISYVAVDDCDAVLETVKQLGGSVPVPPIEFPGIGKFAVIADPQGAHIKPFQMAEPRCPPWSPKEGQFCWAELHTSDIDSARDFYRQVFGWELSEYDMGPMGTYTLFRIGDRDVAGGMNIPGDAQSPPNWMPYLMAGDVDARASQVAGLGGGTCVEPRDIPGVGRFSVHADPAGGVFAFYKSLEK